MSNPSQKPKRRYKRYSSEFKREVLLRAAGEVITHKAVCDEISFLGKEAFHRNTPVCLLVRY